MNPTDLTGYGPTTSGTAPGMQAGRHLAQQQAYTDKMIAALQYSDPSVVDAAMSALRLKTGITDPARLRQELYNTKLGQLSLDGALAARHHGLWGSGSPVNSSANISQTVLGGGFSASVFDAQGRMIGANQNVTGAGVLSERAGLYVQQQLLQGMPSSSNGFNREEMTQVFKHVYGRRGLGDIAAVQRDASLRTRFEAARQTSAPDVADAMTAFGSDRAKMTAYDEAVTRHKSGDSSSLDSFLKTVEDPKLRSALSGVGRSNDAMVFNEAKVKGYRDIMKDMSAGLAAVAELYPELRTMQQRADRLTAITGIVVKDRTTSRQSAQIMDQLIAATPTGVNASAVTGMVQQRGADFRSTFMQVGGLDSRSDSGVIEASAAFARNASIRSIGGDAYELKVQESLGGSGVAVGARTESELFADEQQGAATFIANRRGITSLIGALKAGFLDESTERKARALMARYRSAKTRREKDSLNKQAESLLGGAGGFSTWSQSGAGAAALTAGVASPEFMDSMREERQSAYNYTSMTNITGDEGMSRAIVKSLGHGGLAEIRKFATAPGDNSAAIKGILSQYGMSSADSAAFMKMLAQGGALGSADKFDRLVRATQLTDRANSSNYATEAIADISIKNFGKGDYRKVMKAKGGGVFGMIKSLADGSMDADSAETAPLMIEAMLAEGVKLEGSYASNLNLSKGVKGEQLSKIAAALGTTPEELATRAGYSSVADLEKGTSGSKAKLAAFRNLIAADTHGNVTGSISSTNVMSDAMLKDAEKKDLPGIAKKLAAAGALNPVLGATEQDEMRKAIMEGRDGQFFNTFQSSAYDKSQFGRVARMSNVKRFSNLANLLNSSSADAISGFRAMDSDGTLLRNLESQRNEIQRALDDGRTSVETYGDDGRATKQDINAALIKAFDEAITKLKGGGEQKIAVMTVDKLEITGKAEFPTDTP